MIHFYAVELNYVIYGACVWLDDDDLAATSLNCDLTRDARDDQTRDDVRTL